MYEGMKLDFLLAHMRERKRERKREKAKFITILGNKMLHKKIIMTREKKKRNLIAKKRFMHLNYG
jgi:hypothetical protein